MWHFTHTDPETMRCALTNALANRRLSTNEVKFVYMSKANAEYASKHGKLPHGASYTVSEHSPNHVPANISYLGFIIVKVSADLSDKFDVIIWGNAIKAE